MSGPTGGNRPPRRPKPSSEGSPRPGRDEPAEGPSTFRPNANAGKPSASRRASAVSSRVETGDKPKFWERILFGKVGSGQLSAFCRQAANYLHAGVDINKALVSLQLQFSGTALGPVIGRLQSSVKRGETLTEAVTREPQAFDPLFVSMIRVAEARGGIPETLRQLADHYEARQRLIRQARAALIYPVVVLTMAVGVGIFLAVWLLPMFADLLKDLAGRGGGTLPLPSRLLMSFSDFVRSVGWLVIPAVVVGVPFVLIQAYRTKGGKALMDRLALMTPVFGMLLKKLDTTRFARALASLLDAGVDMGTSLDLATDIVRLEPFRQALRDTKTRVMGGAELSEALLETKRFAPDVIAVINAGEETGKIPESLSHLADDYEEQVEYTVKNLGQLVQPILMIAMGGIVLFIILAVILPYIAAINTLSHG